MDQRYVDTVRACKVIMRNLEHLEDTVTGGQRAELTRLMRKLRDQVQWYLAADEMDEGLWIGEE